MEQHSSVPRRLICMCMHKDKHHHPTPPCCICKSPFDNVSQRPHVAYAGSPVGQRLDLQGSGTDVAHDGYLTTSNTTTPPSRLLCRCFCWWSKHRDLATTLSSCICGCWFLLMTASPRLRFVIRATGGFRGIGICKRRLGKLNVPR